MKLLHTSDWHLGHVLYGYDRHEEQQAMLEQMQEIVRNEKPDVFLICGDIYHTSQPSSTVQTMFTDAIVELHKACPSMAIVITAGNHDSGTRHEIFQTPWRELNVYAIGNIDKEHTENHIIEVPGKGMIIAVPYAYERNIPEGFFQALLDKANELNHTKMPIILTAHTTVAGCDFKGHDNSNERTVGGIDSYNLDQLGSGYDYLALGHIHHAQFIHGSNHRARYCGSPVAVSFDEAYEHSVTIVEIDTHGDAPQARFIAISNPHPLVTLPNNGVATWDEAKELVRNFPSDLPAYLRLNVAVDDFLPQGAMDEARQLVQGKRCTMCHINACRNEHKTSQASMLTVQELKEIAPIDLVRRYAADSGQTFDEEMELLFNEALEAVNQDNRNN